MITEQDLLEAIAECQGAKNPNASTCIKLAAFYTIKEHLYPETEKDLPIPTYSYASEPTARTDVIEYNGDSEFAELVDGKPMQEVMDIVDELVATISVLNPALYRAVIRKLGG